MHKLCTTLSYFKFNSREQHGPFSVSWFKLVEEDGETSGVCLTQRELDELINPNGSKNHNYSVSFDIIGRIDN
jgi:hypothetical protein